MSILEDIHYWVSDKTLYRLEPALSSFDPLRTIYISNEVNDLLQSRIPSLERRGGRLLADLDLFVEGRLVTACLTPFKAINSYMGLLDPVGDGIWDIRSRDPNPAIRVLGGFAEKDVFIALTWGLRKNLLDKDSPQWINAINKCRTEWKRLFPTYSPLTGDDISDYLTSNAIRS